MGPARARMLKSDDIRVISDPAWPPNFGSFREFAREAIGAVDIALDSMQLCDVVIAPKASASALISPFAIQSMSRCWG